MAPRSARAWLVAGSLATVALGCGGGSRADTTPAAGAAGAAGGEAQAGGGGSSSGGGEVVPPEKIDESNRQLSRKRAVMSRCLAIAVDNKELPKNSHGKVTVEIVISPSGTADSVKIVRASLESKMLDECIIGHIKEIAFPQLPRAFEMSYSYGFEAM
jgi:TonB family protein